MWGILYEQQLLVSNFLIYRVFFIYINNDDLQYGSSILIFNAINFKSGDIENFFEKLNYSYWNLNGEFDILKSFVGYSVMDFIL